MPEKLFAREYKGVAVEVWQGDITELEVEAIVNPANSQMWMGGGVAGAIKRKGGEEIEREARKHAPVPIGRAVLTHAGRLANIKYVIHAPTMERPAMATDSAKVRMAVRGALNCAKENGISEVAFPGMGTGVGGVPYEEAARVMVDEIRRHIDEGTALKRVVLIGFDKELADAFRSAVERQLTG